jgi:hypothetical protein
MARKKAKKRPAKKVARKRSTSRSTARKKPARKKATKKRPPAEAGRTTKRKSSQDKGLLDIKSMVYVPNAAAGVHQQVINYLKNLDDGQAIPMPELMKKFDIGSHVVDRIKAKLKEEGLILHARVILKSSEQQVVVFANPKTIKALKR